MVVLNVAIIGTGYIGQVHLNVLKALPGIEDIILVDNNLDHAESLADRYRLPRARREYHSVLSDSSIDVIHNCTPNHLHYSINRDALVAGKHLLSEKPLCLEVGEAEELRDIASSEGLVTGINFCYRYYPAVQEAAARIRTGHIGRVMALHGFFFQDWLHSEHDWSWRLEPEFSGRSNAMADIGSHWCDIAQFLSGMRVVSVFGDLKTLHPIRKRPVGGSLTFSTSGSEEVEEIEVALEDYGSVLFRLENGAVGSFTVCQVCAGHKVDIEIKIFGDQSSMSWSHTKPGEVVYGYRDGENRHFYENSQQQNHQTATFARLPSGHPMGYHDAVYNLFREFYSQIDTGEKIHTGCPDFSDGISAMRIVEAIVRSNNSQSWIDVF